MPTRPDPSAVFAAKQAKSPAVAGLFDQLASRAQVFAQMQDEFLESSIRHREERTGKPLRHTKGQQRSLDQFDRDAEQAIREMERRTATMDDKHLLISALSSEYLLLEVDEGMAASHRPEDREMAQRLVDFRRETIRLIEQFVETSPFKGQVVSLWRAKTRKFKGAK
jgi:hypothetical protein